MIVLPIVLQSDLNLFFKSLIILYGLDSYIVGRIIHFFPIGIPTNLQRCCLLRTSILSALKVFVVARFNRIVFPGKILTFCAIIEPLCNKSSLMFILEYPNFRMGVDYTSSLHRERDLSSDRSPLRIMID